VLASDQAWLTRAAARDNKAAPFSPTPELSLADDLMSDPVSFVAAALIRNGIDTEIVRRVTGDARRVFGGSQVYIKVMDRPARDAEIKRLLGLGVSPEGVARHVKTSVSTVRRRRSDWL